MVYRKANKRTTEVWSIAERLFQKDYYLRMRLFDVLVKPVILYGAEVTGCVGGERYEAIQRRYAKWTLGLPKATRTAVLETECSLKPITVARFERTMNYISKCNATELVVAARGERKARNGNWWSKLKSTLQGLGWNADEALERLAMDASFRLQLGRRMEDQLLQSRGVELKKATFYAQNVGPPPYLKGEHFKTVGRLRCEAESWAHQDWRDSKICRVCGDVGTCVALRRCVYAQDHMGNCRRGTEVGSLPKSTGVNNCK